uniref:PTS glucose transporter subunit IIA n=1 Tax=Staphylococcus aureus TaxID=1280 RepID=UPI00164323E3
MIFPTKHPIPLVSHTPLQLLIHIRLHTLKLNPQAFTLHLDQAQQLKQPHLLINFHLHYIPNHPNTHITPIILTQPNITNLHFKQAQHANISFPHQLFQAK